MLAGRYNPLVVVVSAIGLMFLLLGLLALALPISTEGTLLWELSSQRAVHLMDVIGLLLLGLGLALTWLSSRIWNRQLLP